MGPAGYFLTIHSYGTWLHGDERGSIDRKNHNVPGTPMVAANAECKKMERKLLKQPPVQFKKSQRILINRTISEVASYNKWYLHAINVRIEHVHVVVTASKSPESVMNSFKSWATRRMREAGLWINTLSPWARHGSTRYLWYEKEIYEACRYVLDGQNIKTPPSQSGHGI